MSFLDFPSSAAAVTPESLAPEKFTAKCLGNHKAEGSSINARWTSVKTVVQLDTPETVDQEDVKFCFSSLLMDAVNGTADESTLRLLSNEAEKKIISQLISEKESCQDMAIERRETRKPRRLLPPSPLARSEAGIHFLNGNSNKKDNGNRSYDQGPPFQLAQMSGSSLSASRRQPENQPGSSSRMDSPLMQDTDLDTHQRPFYSTIRGDSYDHNVPVYPPMLLSAIPASTDEYSNWITNFRTKRMQTMATPLINSDLEELDRTFRLENPMEIGDNKVPLSPTFDYSKSEVGYWKDQTALGRHFCEDAEMMDGYLVGRGALTDGNQSGESADKLLVDDVFETPSLKHEDAFSDQNKFGTSSRYYSYKIDDFSPSTNGLMKLGQLWEKEVNVNGFQNTFQQDQVSSVIERRAKRAHRTSPIDAAEQIEKMKRDAKIARKMEPELAYDSKRLNIDFFEASVDTAKPDEDHNKNVEIDMNGLYQ